MALPYNVDQSTDDRDLSDIDVQSIVFDPSIDYQGHGWQYPMRFGGDSLEAAMIAGDRSDPQYITHEVTSSTDQKLLEVHISLPSDVDQKEDPSQVLVYQCGQDFKYNTLLPRMKAAREAWPNCIIVIVPSRKGRAQDMTYVHDSLDQLRFLYCSETILPIHKVIFYMLSFGNSIGMYALTALEAAGKSFGDGIIMDSPPMDLIGTLEFWIPKTPVVQTALNTMLTYFTPASDRGLPCTTRRDCLKASAFWRVLEKRRSVRIPVWVIKSEHDRKVRPSDADEIFKAISTDNGDVSYLTSACASHTQFGYFAPFKTLFVNFIVRVREGAEPDLIRDNQGAVILTPRPCAVHRSEEYDSTCADDPARVVSVRDV